MLACGGAGSVERPVRWAEPDMAELSKAARKAIRDAADVAYQRELDAELEELAQDFADWKAGKLSAVSLVEAIHDFHQGPARQLFNRYGASSVPDFALAAAVVAGFIQLQEIATPGREHIAKIVSVEQLS